MNNYQFILSLIYGVFLLQVWVKVNNYPAWAVLLLAVVVPLAPLVVLAADKGCESILKRTRRFKEEKGE